MTGAVRVGRGDRHELALAHQLVQQLRVVHDLVVPVQLRVLAAQRVQAVRAGRDDLAGARLAALEHAR